MLDSEVEGLAGGDLIELYHFAIGGLDDSNDVR